jgi:hypothetical protein
MKNYIKRRAQSTIAVLFLSNHIKSMQAFFKDTVGINPGLTSELYPICVKSYVNGVRANNGSLAMHAAYVCVLQTYQGLSLQKKGI